MSAVPRCLELQRLQDGGWTHEAQTLLWDPMVLEFEDASPDHSGVGFRPDSPIGLS
jgi:hypothetical protein